MHVPPITDLEIGNIEITDDEAAADVFGNQEGIGPLRERWFLVREDGEWKFDRPEGLVEDPNAPGG